MLEKTALFEAGNLFAAYRIPGVIATEKGTLIAYCEARDGGSDWSACAAIMRRSTDGGRTWGAHTALVPRRATTVNNPVMIASRMGKVHLLWLEDYKTLYHQVSDDDGATFSSPRQLDVLEEYRVEYDWTCAAVGPGHGIETRGGRLIVPIWLAKGEGRNHYPSKMSSIVSADGGKTWHRGDLVGDDGAPFSSPNETSVAEMPDGMLLYSIRHRGDQRVRWQARSVDGLHFTDLLPAGDLPDPRCFGSLAAEGDTLVYAGCLCDSRRDWLMVAKSEDRGRTWRKRKLMEARNAGYADVLLNEDSVFCLYEQGWENGNPDIPHSLTLAVFPKAALDSPENARELATAIQAYTAQ